MISFKQIFFITFSLLVISPSAFPRPAASAPSAEQMLKAADSVRNPAENYKMTVVVKTPDNETTFEVLLKGTSKTLILTKAPAKDRGRNMLMLDRDFYSYIPNLKRSIRLSLQQKFSGQVANGDIARTRWYGDYSPKIESRDPKTTILFLDGLKNNLTYQKIRLWLENGTGRPLRAEYLALDGKTVLKRASFESYKMLAGSLRPSVIRIEDATKQQSMITIKNMAPADLDDALFTQHNLEVQ